jgi:monoamine oxidase
MKSKTRKIDTIIIGGGLCGIYCAYIMSAMKKQFLLFEGRPRLGGRILCTRHANFSADLGPSWYWPEINPDLIHLINELGLEGYPQFENGKGRFQYADGTVATVRGYASEPESWRLYGGMISIIDRLVDKIPEPCIRCSHPVCEIKKDDHSGVIVCVGNHGQDHKMQYIADNVILALPPRLAASSILFTPDLSHDLTQAMLRTSTWMAGQAKFYVLYEKPFWRRQELSGQAFSQTGPLSEIHDGSNEKAGPYGLTGFVGVPPFQRRDRQILLRQIFSQLSAVFGEPAESPVKFYYQDWAYEPFTATQFDQTAVHEHPLYSPSDGRTSIWGGSVQLAGSETSGRFAGYLQGALESAKRAVSQIL